MKECDRSFEYEFGIDFEGMHYKDGKKNHIKLSSVFKSPFRFQDGHLRIYIDDELFFKDIKKAIDNHIDRLKNPIPKDYDYMKDPKY